MPLSKPPARDPISLLLASPDLDDYALLTSDLAAKGLRTKLIITPTAEQTLAYLHDSWVTTLDFPRLVLLDGALLQPDPAWSLLTAIQSTYPGLPLVLLSPDDSAEIVMAAYQRGVRTVVVKSADSQSWVQLLGALTDYWLNAVNLPRLMI